MRMKTESFVFNKVRENTHVLWNESGEGVVIDPGCSDENEERRLASFLAEQGIRPLAALITHSHFDHVAGIAFLAGRYGTEVWISEKESDELDRVSEYSSLYFMHIDQPDRKKIRFFPAGTERLSFGSIEARVIPLPGHTPGSVGYYFPEAGTLAAGDALRKGGMGTTETGYSEMLKYLQFHVLSLPEDTRLLFGHGEPSTVGWEKRYNRFFKQSPSV